MIRGKYFFILLILAIFIFQTSYSQNGPKYKLDAIDNPSPGYLLIGPLSDNYVSLYDNLGKPVHSKNITKYGGHPNALRVLSNGKLAYYSSATWFILDRQLNVTDQLKATPPYKANFHTIRTAPNGNYLFAADEVITVNMQEKVEGGKTNARIWNIIIQEFDVHKNLVFNWDCFDHIEVTSATEDVNLTYGEIDPYHINSADYDWDGNIIANFRNLDAIIKINRSSGQIMWVMGGSKCKINQFTFINDTKDGFTGFSHQHDPHRLPNGNILLFDNANLSPGKSSRAVEYQINEYFKTARKVWEYHYSPAISADFQGNAQRLPNGNTLIGWGNNVRGKLCTEVTPNGKIVLDMSLNGNTVSYQVLRHNILMNTVTHNINSLKMYNFNDNENNTGVSLNITSLTGSGLASIEKHDYQAHNIMYESIFACNVLPYRWVLNYRNITSLKGKIFISLANHNDFLNKDELKIFWRETEGMGAFKILNTTYNFESNRLEAEIDHHGEFILGYLSNIPPSLTSPENNAENLKLKTTLKWKSNSEGKDFICQVALDENFESLIYEKTVSNTNQMTCELNDNFKKHYWRVKGISSQCDKNWSDIYTFTTEIGTAKLLSPEDKAQHIPLEIELKWNPVDGANNYFIQVSEDPNFNSYLVSLNNADKCNYIINNLKPLTYYYWRVFTGVNGEIKSISGSFSFRTGNTKIVLESPPNQNLQTATSGFLRWIAHSSVNQYSLQLSDSPEFVHSIIDTLISEKTEMEYMDLQNSKTYYWRVKGFVQDKLTDWSDIWQFRTKIGTTVLLNPKNNSTDNEISGKIEWETTKDAIYYHVQIASDTNFSNLLINNMTEIANWLFYQNFSWNSNFYWRVRVFDGQDYGDWSTMFSFSTISELISPNFDAYKVPVTVTLEWNQTPNTTFYELMVSTDSSLIDENQFYTNIGTNNYQVTELKNNTTYYWSIRSVRSTKLADWSEAYKFTTKLVKPEVLLPLDDSHNHIVGNPLNFNWTKTEGRDYYQIQIATDLSFMNIIVDSSNLTTEQFVLNDILPEGKYYWRISAENSKNSSKWSRTGKFTISPAVDVKDNDNLENEIFVYPNPINSETSFNFSISKPEYVQIKIYSIEGKEIEVVVNEFLQAGNYQYKLNSSLLNSGIYYYVFHSGNNIKAEKLILAK